MLTCPYSLNHHDKLVESHPFYSKEYLIYHSCFWVVWNKWCCLSNPAQGQSPLKWNQKLLVEWNPLGHCTGWRKKLVYMVWSNSKEQTDLNTVILRLCTIMEVIIHQPCSVFSMGGSLSWKLQSTNGIYFSNLFWISCYCFIIEILYFSFFKTIIELYIALLHIYLNLSVFSLTFYKKCNVIKWLIIW